MSSTETIKPARYNFLPDELTVELRNLAEQIEIPAYPTMNDCRDILERHNLPWRLSRLVELYGIVERDFLFQQKVIIGHLEVESEKPQQDFYATVYMRHRETRDEPDLPWEFHAFKVDLDKGMPSMHLDMPLNPNYSLDRQRPLWRVDSVTPTSYLEALKIVLPEIADALEEPL